MPPVLAFLLTSAFVLFLFRRDVRQKPNVTSALWLPLLWVLLIGTRSATQWLSLTELVEVSSTEEGNPLDAVIYLGLIGIGCYVLHKRQVRLTEVIRNNQWLTLFLLYCLLAITWSDFPAI